MRDVDPVDRPEGGFPAQREAVALAMDLGGNWIRVALVTRVGEILWRERIPTDAHEGGPPVIARMEASFKRGLSQIKDRTLAGIGMGLAGPVDPDTGVMYMPPNIPGLDGVSFKSLWEPQVELPIMVGNDATLAALGEYRYGAGVGARTLVYMTISTGIGGGIVVEGRPIWGANGMAGELGHMSIDVNGRRCKCGSVGCLEAYASGTAIADAARTRLATHGGSLVLEAALGQLDNVTSEVVFEAASWGDAMALEVVAEAARALGAGLVNVLHIFNPDVIVIGGGVSTSWEHLEPGVRAYIDANAMSHVRKMGFKLVVSAHGDDAALVGAAALVWQRIEEAS